MEGRDDEAQKTLVVCVTTAAMIVASAFVHMIHIASHS